MHVLHTDVTCDESIIDFGASHHITHCAQLLDKCRSLNYHEYSEVQVPTESKIKIQHVGDNVVLGGYILKNVLHVPNFKFNLLSVS